MASSASEEALQASLPKKLKENEGACALVSDPGNSSSVAGSADSIDLLKISTSGSSNSNVVKTSNGVSSNDDDDMSIEDDDGDDDNEYDYDDNDDNDGFLYDDDDYMTLQSHFDNVNLPPGVEAPLPWLNDPSPSENLASTKTLTISDLPPCSSTVPSESSSSTKPADSIDDCTIQNSQQFKQFDIVEDFSDHHYSRMGFSDEQPPKSWAKRIQEEWKILEKDLPDTIFVRVYEARMELLRAVIIGPPGTPYHDGLFVFDCLFPTNYPKSPPMVYYYSGGLRLNPNLYECGKVCLSLLGTWSGKQNENWVPGQSTMLQVLVSIQALILNADPFFNEPGYDTTYVGAEGQKRSRSYNEEVFILSLKTMMYTLRRPPKYFEDFVLGHFRNRAHNILAACKAYTEGTLVGSVSEDAAQNVENSGSKQFKSSVARMMNMLITNFTKNGSTDCEQFRVGA
ncbi:PREDICTED: probable ubiquitin-conjugating enzyme [Prunus dulcis]|uniref:E2 ubiquitin-conjugating enzyme n=1 Tax=Prunus dulcis TaxID=3755 RepID=A0A5E4G9C8_PRUDU|nr:PREDICTED: probable ubiquitin-conjugating enzyme [Prunus dulcis]